MAALLGRLLAAHRTEPTSVVTCRCDYLGRLVRAFEPATGRAAAADTAPTAAVVPGLVSR